MPTEGQLRVWWIRNVPNEPDLYDVANIQEAIAVIEENTGLDLNAPQVTSNAGGLEVYEDGEWVEYYDEEGRDIDEIIDSAPEGVMDDPSPV